MYKIRSYKIIQSYILINTLTLEAFSVYHGTPQIVIYQTFITIQILIKIIQRFRFTQVQLTH